MNRVDEFDHTGEPVTPKELAELLPFWDRCYPGFGAELRQLFGTPGVEGLPNLFRIATDDMRRVQAGHEPRYIPFAKPMEKK